MISETWIDRDCFAALAMTAWQTFYESVNFSRLTFLAMRSDSAFPPTGIGFE